MALGAYNAAVKITWAGRREYELRMRTADRRLRREQKRMTRKAANVVKDAARKEIRQEFGGRGKDKRRPDGRKPGGLARSTSVSVRARGGTVTAEIGPKYPHGAYGKLFEVGGVSHKRRAHTRTRRGTRSQYHSVTTSKVKAHATHYEKRPWLAPALQSTTEQVYSLIGASFRVV